MGKKVVILGGGFGGVTAAKAFKGTDFEVTIIDKTNHNLFLPVLYQVAAGAMSPGDIAIPIRSLVKKLKNVRVVQAEVTNIDIENKKVQTDQSAFDYDFLIVAIGQRASYFGHDEWAEYAIGVRTLKDALTIKERMINSFEKAEISDDPKEVERLLTFVVVGGGPIGVETSGALAELTRKSIKNNYRNVDLSKTKIILIEALDKILPAFSLKMSTKVIDDLKKLGVDVRLKTMVTGIDENGVQTSEGYIETQNIIWGAGAQGYPVIKTMNVETDRGLRVIVEDDFSVKDHPEVFVIGDAAALMGADGRPLPAVAPTATQGARYVADIIKKGTPRDQRKPFKFFDKGNMAVVCRAKAVLESHGVRMSGFPAWVVWLVVHLAVLLCGRSRYKVMAEWVWHYIGKDYGVRAVQ